MGKGMENLEAAYHFIFTAALIVLAVLVILCLVRAIIGPRVADRIVSVNMTGTMVIVMIAILALMLEEGYLVDICIIYAMISFLAVIVLVKVYMGVYLQEKREDSHGGGTAAGNAGGQKSEPSAAGNVMERKSGPGEAEGAGEAGRADERKSGPGEAEGVREAGSTDEQKVKMEEMVTAAGTGSNPQRTGQEKGNGNLRIKQAKRSKNG